MSWGDTQNRIDPIFYRSIGYSFDGWGKVKQYASVKGGKRIPLGDTYAQEDTGLYYLRVDNLSDHCEISGELKWLRPETYKELVRYQVVNGDVLVSIAGTIGRTSVFYENNVNGPTILTENCAKMKVTEEIIPEYMMLLLASRPLQAQMERDYIQTTIPKLGLDRIRQLLIPKIPGYSKQRKTIELWHNGIQSYQNTRARANNLIVSIDDYLLSELGISLPPVPTNTLESRIFRAQRCEIAGWRFDPEALHPERESCIAELQSHPTVKLWKAARFCRDLRNEVPEGLIYIGLENVESNTGRYVPSSDKESVSSAFYFRKGQILFPKLRPYLNKVFHAPFDGLCSTEFHVLEGIGYINEFLAVFLRSQIVVKQTKHIMSGNTLPRLQTDDIKNLLVPIVDLQLQERIVLESRKRDNDAEALIKLADAELDQSKRQIEAMLLGG